MKKRDKILFAVGAVMIMLGVGVWFYSWLTELLYGNREAVYETYTVKTGDTFWDIAQKYRDRDCRNIYIMEYKYELEKINSEVKPGNLRAGDKLKIRYYISKEAD